MALKEKHKCIDYVVSQNNFKSEFPLSFFQEDLQIKHLPDVIRHMGRVSIVRASLCSHGIKYLVFRN